MGTGEGDLRALIPAQTPRTPQERTPPTVRCGAVLHIWDGYVQYPTPPKLCDQALRDTSGRVNPAEYVQYLPKPAPRQGVGSCSTGGGVDRAGHRRLGF